MKHKRRIGQDICDRTRKFAICIVRFYAALKKDEVGRILGKQLLRSGTSIGANVEEGQGAQSRRDFLHKMRISLKEARETIYWLTIIHETRTDLKVTTAALLAEADQIARIIFTIIRNTEQNIKTKGAL